MRRALFFAVTCMAVRHAHAQPQPPPIDPYQPNQPYPYDTALSVQPAAPGAPPVIVQPPPPVTVQPSQAQPTPPAAPPGGYDPPPSGYYYPPPGWAAPYYSYPPPQYPAPPAYYPPPRRIGPACPRGGCVRRSRPPGRARFFSLGARASSLTINQQIGDKTVTLGGGGLEMRFRTRGRFGIETSVDALHGDFQLNGPVSRDSLPISLSALLYIFPNTDARIFNLYFLGGVGVVATKMKLTDPAGSQVEQDFTEYEAHVGVGAELRFRWIALRGDLRGMRLWRDDNHGAGPLYRGVEGAPVPAHSTGLLATVGGAFWF